MIVALSALRVEPWFAVDVTTRVMLELAAAPAPRRNEVTPLQLGWAGSVAFVAGVGLIVGLWALVPELTRLASAAWGQLSAASGLMSAATTFIAALLSAATKTGAGLFVAARALATSVAELKQVAVVTLILCSAMMTTVIVLVVGRDLRRVTLIQEDPR